MRQINQAGLDMIKYFEGWRDKPYDDGAGFMTVGYGHKILPSDTIPVPITKFEGESLLRSDLYDAERAVLRLIKIPLTDNQFAALVSFTFNLGGGALQRSTLRQKVNRKEHGEVPAEFMKWVRAGGRKLPGLIKRRAAEAALYVRKDAA